ncbi:nucleotidyltransferase family protein [Desulfurobacterium crinifex]
MALEAIVLAGGFGTRLKKLVSDVPKPMAPIGGVPFLEYLLNFLLLQGIEKVILAVGYKYECIVKHFGISYKGLLIEYSVEDKPLGTGGGIRKAMALAESEDVVVLNGDTFFNIPFKDFLRFHRSKKAFLTIALKYLSSCQRYGVVDIDRDGKIIGFHEKAAYLEGFVNAGIYILKKEWFLSLSSPEVFSFEKDFLQKKYKKFVFFGKPYDNYFIDIGIPEDYMKAQREIPVYAGNV